jgi:phenylalanyl-tRNA synthetase beta chain
MQPLITLKPETEVKQDALHNLLIARGYQEAITYSFVPPEIESLLSAGADQIRLANPISDELSVMRGTLWSGLIPALDRNVKRQQGRVRLFETGLTFEKSATGLPIQRKKLAGVITGLLYAEQWDADKRAVDFYDVKGDVEALLGEANGQSFEFLAAGHAALHPGQSAKIISDGQAVGLCGALHPALEKKLDLDQPVFVFELDLDWMLKKKMPAYSQLSPLPSIRRDLALLVDQTVAYAEISASLDKLVNQQIPEFVDYMIFDVYSGEKLDSEQKSLALGLIFQDFSRTLEEEEIGAHIEKVMSTLKKDVGAVLR